MGGHSTDMLPGSAAGPVKTPYLGYREGEWEGGGESFGCQLTVGS